VSNSTPFLFWWIEEPHTESYTRTFHLSQNQFTDQQINKSTNQQINKSTNRHIDKSTNRQIDKSTNNYRVSHQNKTPSGSFTNTGCNVFFKEYN
jgi:hypothetical protein